MQELEHIRTVLATSLEAAVPLWAERFKDTWQEELFKDKDRISSMLAERGDVLMFGSKKKGEQAALFNDFAKAVALMSFMPGGVKLFGLHFENGATIAYIQNHPTA